MLKGFYIYDCYIYICDFTNWKSAEQEICGCLLGILHLLNKQIQTDKVVYMGNLKI